MNVKFEDVVVSAANQVIIDAVLAAHGVVQDEHNPGTTLKLGAVAVITSDTAKCDNDQVVVALLIGDSATVPYYSINEVDLVEGQPRVTRNARSAMHKATPDIIADVNNYHASYDWDMIEKKPFMKPPIITNVTLIPAE